MGEESRSALRDEGLQGEWRLPPKQKILLEGETSFDLHRAATELTVVISTSIGNFTPSTDVVVATLESLQANVALHHCRKLLVFDKVPSQTAVDQLRLDDQNFKEVVRGQKWMSLWNEKRSAYDEYCQALQGMSKNNHPALYKVELLFLPHFGHLFGTVKMAISHISTPYVLITQHDLQLSSRFVAEDVQRTLDALLGGIANYVVLNRDVNSGSRTSKYFRMLPEKSRSASASCPNLTAVAGFSDQAHFARVSWYWHEVIEEIVKMLGESDQTCMEHVLHDAWRGSDHNGGFLYGTLQDGPFVYDLVHGVQVKDMSGKLIGLPSMPARRVFG